MSNLQSKLVYLLLSLNCQWSIAWSSLLRSIHLGGKLGSLNWESAKAKVKREVTGKRRGGEACNHFFKRPVPVYQLQVYPLIGQIW